MFVQFKMFNFISYFKPNFTFIVKFISLSTSISGTHLFAYHQPSFIQYFR